MAQQQQHQNQQKQSNRGSAGGNAGNTGNTQKSEQGTQSGGQKQDQKLGGLGDMSNIGDASLKDIAGEVTQRVTEKYESAKETLRSSRENFRDLDQRLRTQLEARPFVVLGSALGVGYLLGSRIFGLVPRVLMLIGAKSVISELSNQGVFEKLKLRAGH